MQKSFIHQSTHFSYRIEGKGNAVVLLHGFGEDGSIWDQQILFLKDHCLLIIPDLPGSGGSERLSLELGVRSRELENKNTTQNTPSSIQTPYSRLHSPDYISIDDYADCIHSLLVHEKINSCNLLGHSMGGYICLAFAEKYPNFLSGFGLIHSTAFADNEEKKMVREKAIELMDAYGPHPFLRNTIPNLFGRNFKERYPEKINALIESSANFTKESLQQYYKAMMLRPDRTNVLKSNQLPILFVAGREDVAVPLDDILKQVSLPNISYLYVLQNTGHMGMWEEPEKLNKKLLDFINRNL